MNFMRAEHCECEFLRELAELRECKCYELSFVNWNFTRSEHCECEFYELSFAHVNFMRAELCKCEFYES